MKEIIGANVAPVKGSSYLSEASEKDAKWDSHRKNSQSVELLYKQNPDYERLAERMSSCASLLGFANITDTDTGEMFLKLRSAKFCHVRHCPVCAWRRSQRNTARFFEKMPDFQKVYFPVPHFLFLTLTVKNCALTDLRETLKKMNHAWGKLAKRLDRKKYWHGWIRSTEVTKSKNGEAHPHFHCLLMVPSSAFTHKYIKQSEWSEMWKDCLGADYQPVVDIRKVKALLNGQLLEEGDTELRASSLNRSVIETLKYQVKAEDIIDDPAWLYGLTEQLYKTRFLATGGILKNLLKEQMTDEEMIAGDEPSDEPEEQEKITFYRWDRKQQRYVAKE